MKRNLMKRAHEIARSLKGDYRARMSMALRQAWKEERGMKITLENIIKIEDLPKLEGTPKQVAWAEEIRKDNFNIIITERCVPRMKDNEGSLPSQFIPVYLAAKKVFLEAPTNAAWWVENYRKGKTYLWRILLNEWEKAIKKEATQ
jgi:hypothetical protein